MNLITGIDPGVTTGWCCYDPEAKRVVASGLFKNEHIDIPISWLRVSTNIVIERPQGYGHTRPEMVDCGIVAGQIHERLRLHQPQTHAVVEWLTRREVKKILSEATLRDIVVKDDKSAWAALKLLHGEGCDKKGGSLYGVKSHGRAALAVAVAWAHRSTSLLSPPQGVQG